MKYHYFYRFFTYSVKRSRGRKALVSGVEAHMRSRHRSRSAPASLVVVAFAAACGAWSVARSVTGAGARDPL